MVKAVIVAAAVLSGAPWPAVAIAALAVWQPLALIAAVPLWVWHERRRRRGSHPDADDEATMLRSFASELEAGASLRAALVVAADRAPRLDLAGVSRMAAAGLPARRIAEGIATALPVNGRLASAVWSLASDSGGPAAAVARSLAVRAADEGVLQRERRALTAQARASAWVVAGLPVILIAFLAALGRLPVADPALFPVLIAGLGLQAAGVAAVAVMLRRAER